MREPLGMTNSRIGYVYLVDENLKVRWAACAEAETGEEEALIRCAGVLVNRLEQPSSTRTPSPREWQRRSEEK